MTKQPFTLQISMEQLSSLLGSLSLSTDKLQVLENVQPALGKLTRCLFADFAFFLYSGSRLALSHVGKSLQQDLLGRT